LTKDDGEERAMSDTEKSSSGPAYEERIKHVAVIAKPLASKKHTKRVYKAVKKATKAKGIKRGVKEVVKGIRKGDKGLCIIAGDISPIDVISHIPVLCEENDIPYIFTPSKVRSSAFSLVELDGGGLMMALFWTQVDLGASALSKRPTSCILITPGKAGFDAGEAFDELLAEVKQIQPVY
jgi:H/ACA ribonucleoprotein complex subunit 2